MDNKLAIVTQTYGADINECRLLSKSIDRFVPKTIEHHIFINDEDFDLFIKDRYFKDKFLHKKSEILPKYLFNLPYKILGHKYHISPFSLPIREWIIKQICKIGAFETLPSRIEAIINIDSECIFIKPFKEDLFIKDNKYLLFRENFKEEPNHNNYCRIGQKILGLNEPISELTKYCYQSASVVFEKNNINFLEKEIARKSLFHNWKLKLCNTYRFSEYYLYGLCCNYLLDNNHHFVSNIRPFPMLNISTMDFHKFCQSIFDAIADNNVQGVWLQKHQRNNPNIANLDFDLINRFIEQKVFKQ